MPYIYYLYIFPADPLVPKPDWPPLRAQLLRSGLLQEKIGGTAPEYDFDRFWGDIRRDRHLQHVKIPVHNIRSLGQLVQNLIAVGVVPPGFQSGHEATSIPDLAASLRAGGFVSTDFALSFEEEFEIGPSFDKFCDGALEHREAVISYRDEGNGVAFIAESIYWTLR